MLYLVLLKVDPLTSVSIKNHRKAIKTATMQKHKNDVSALIPFIEAYHKDIIANGRSFEEKGTLLRHSLAALSSGPNANFNKLIESIDHDVCSGIGYCQFLICYSELNLRVYQTQLSEPCWHWN